MVSFGSVHTAISVGILLIIGSCQGLSFPNSTLGPEKVPWKETGKAKVDLTPFLEPGNFMKDSLTALCSADSTASSSCKSILSGHRTGLENIYAFLREGEVEWGERMLENCWTLSTRQPEICFNGTIPTWTENPFDEPFWRFLFYSLRPMRHLLVDYFQADKDNDEAHRVRIRQIIFDCISSFEQTDIESPWVYDFHDLHGVAFRSMVLSEFYWLFQHFLDYGELNAILRLQWRSVEFMMQEDNWQKTNNHGFNQAVAVFGAAVNFPFLQDSAKWEATGLERLKYFMESTIDEEGVLIENSPFYHNYMLKKVSDLFSWAIDYDLMLPKVYGTRIPLMLDYAMDMAQPDLKFPLVGASVSSNYLSDGDFKALEHLRPRLAWQRSHGKRGDPQVDDPEAMYSSEYSISGQLSFRSSWNPRDNVSFWFVDIGPYRSKHCDFDFFHFTWFRNEEILVDSGLGTYAETPYHSYFHGTRSHNVIYVDNATQPEDFPYTRNKVQTHKNWSGVSGNMTVEGNYSWSRSFLFIGDDNFLIFDDIYGLDNRNHTFAAMWHFPEETTISPLKGGLNVSNQEGRQLARLQSISSSTLANNIISGETDPIQGWVSRTYQNYSAAPAVSQVASDVPNLRLVSFWTSNPHSSATVKSGLDLKDVSNVTSGFSSNEVVVALDLGGYGSAVEVTFHGVECMETSHGFCRNWNFSVSDFLAPSPSNLAQRSTNLKGTTSAHYELQRK